MEPQYNQSDERFTEIAEMSPDGIMTANMGGYITYVNPAFVYLTGFSEEELVGKHVLNLPTLKGRNIKSYIGIVKDFMKGTLTSTSFEFPYNRKDGSSGIGEAFFKTILVNGKKEVMGILKDVTDRKIKEEEYHNIFKSSPIGIMHVDLEGIIKNINDSCLEILGIKKSDYIGESIFNIEDDLGENKIDLKKIYNKILLEGFIDPFSIIIEVEGNTRVIEIELGLIKIHSENLGIQVLLRNITDQVKDKEKQKLYTEELERMVDERTKQIIDNEKMVALGRVSSMLAHDLKGPLQIINNSVYLAKRENKTDSKYLDYISKAVNQADELILEMNQLAKSSQLKLEYVDLRKLVNESLFQVKTSEEIEFETHITIDKNIMLDRSKILRVLINMLKNAVESMPNGGKICVVAEEKVNQVTIQVSDTGVGIPEEQLSKIFRPFQSTKDIGIGLGLAYCKSAVEAHGGNIVVDSEVGKGTTFTITIPLYIEDNREQLDIIKDTLISRE
jgi:PAS domain S-box-containing protein